MIIDIEYEFDAEKDPSRPFIAKTNIQGIDVYIYSGDSFSEAKLDLIHKVKDLVLKIPETIPEQETVDTDDYNGEE